jgi:hypothetical protein
MHAQKHHRADAKDEEDEQVPVAKPLKIGAQQRGDSDGGHRPEGEDAGPKAAEAEYLKETDQDHQRNPDRQRC